MRLIPVALANSFNVMRRPQATAFAVIIPLVSIYIIVLP